MKKIFLVLIFLFSAYNVYADEKNVDLSPIGHSSINRDSLTSAELYSIFTLVFRYWDDGRRIRVYILNETYDIHEEFLWKFLRLTPRRYLELIDKETSGGGASPPIRVSSEIEMIKAIRKDRGGIGYIGDGNFLVSGGNNVKIFEVILR